MSQASKKKTLEYLTSDNESPYSDWLKALGDVRAKTKVTRATHNMSLGNFGDHKGVGDSVMERRLTYGPGYRIYYAMDGNQIVLLLTGGDKSSQQKDIEKAKAYWADYKARKLKGDDHGANT
ncbi:MAG: type II toxin-antitoxin system RelE/ParE family toxin [Halopseudomonas sp.]